MAKSMRSKSQRKNRAVLRSGIYKAAADARLHRIALQDTAETLMKELNTSTAKPVEHNEAQAQTNSPVASLKRRRSKTPKTFSEYGLSAKETRF